VPTDLRHDPEFLERLIREAGRLHRPGSLEEATMLADIRDYFLYLTMDAFEDPELARELVGAFTKLEVWLGKVVRDAWGGKIDPTAPIFYGAFLFALEHLLCLRHRIALMPGEKISREEFMESWRRTSRKLGLQPCGVSELKRKGGERCGKEER